jgi:hypothetical protein
MRMRIVGEPSKQRVTWVPLGVGFSGNLRPLQQQEDNSKKHMKPTAEQQ